jgi:hypothetical protein
LSETRRHGATGGGARGVWPWAAALLLLAATGLALRWQGRLWACDCGRILFWTSDAWSSDTSQHLFDPYAFTHVLHGIVFCGLLALIVPRLPPSRRFLLAVAAEAVWEVVENSAFVINRYREATAALGYTGDTVLNSLGDIIACALGFLAASRLGLVRSIILFILVELVLLLTIKDSLVLNIIMLIHPLEGIRQWQTAH